MLPCLDQPFVTFLCFLRVERPEFVGGVVVVAVEPLWVQSDWAAGRANEGVGIGPVFFKLIRQTGQTSPERHARWDAPSVPLISLGMLFNCVLGRYDV